MAINDVAEKKGCIMYDISFVNFWVTILCPVFLIKNIKILKS